MKHHCLIKKLFTVAQKWKASKLLIIGTQKRVYKEFKSKNLGDYHGLCFQSDTLLLEDVFKNFGNKCIEIYELDPCHFLSAPGLAWQACLKNTEVKLEFLTDIDKLLVVEKGIRGGIC